MNCPKCRAETSETARFCAECGAPLRAGDDAPRGTMTLETPREELASGSTFAGRYQIIEELGRGGMGNVYKVFDKEIHAKIALKLIKPEVAADPGTIERFRNELRTARDVSHKHICRTYDLGRDGGLHYITMEYVPGEDLKAMIRMSGRLGTGTAVAVARQACEGLAEAHRRGIIHRDLKPSNIMIDREGQVRILDFGIARSIRARGVTGAGFVVGTPEYMSPEQVEGGEVDSRSDLYSLGIVLYEMITGRVPFAGDTPFSVGVKQRSERPEDPRTINPDIPDDLDRLVLRCLEKDPERRYPSAEALGADLERIAKRLPATERALPRRKPSTTRRIATALRQRKARLPLAVAGTAVLAFAAFLLLKKAPAAASHRHGVAVMTFENQTGDTSYDYLGKAIPSLLITSLEQSRDLSVLTWERMRDVLKQMGIDADRTIDTDLGFELCRREGVETIVLGSYVKAGEVFATDVKVMDVGTKRLIKSVGSKGDGLRSILDRQIGDLSREIERGAGLSGRLKADKGAAIARNTTSSMEAYEAYLKGREQYEKFYYAEALRLLETAVDLDPGFAMAHLALARVHAALGDSPAMEKSFKKAKALSEKCAEKDRLLIESGYANAIEHDPEKSVRILKEIAKKYPKEKSVWFDLGADLRNRGQLEPAVAQFRKALELDPNYGYALNMLAYTYADMGDYGKAIETFERYAALSPGDVNPYDSLAETFLRMGNLAKSEDMYRKVVTMKPDFSASYWALAYVLALREKYPDALEAIEEFIDRSPSLGMKGRGSFGRAFYLFWSGRCAEAAAELERLAGLADSMGYTEGLGGSYYLLACVRTRQGRYEEARQSTQRWHAVVASESSSANPDREVLNGILLTRIDLAQGMIKEARDRFDQTERVIPKTGGMKTPGLEPLHQRLMGEVLLAEGRIDKAIQVLESAAPFEKPPTIQGILSLYNSPFPKDALARAYLAKGLPDKAIAEYERLATFDPARPDRTLIDPRLNYGLARACERKGLRDEAAAKYRRFLELWKDADKDLPEVVDAKARLAALSR